MYKLVLSKGASHRVLRARAKRLWVPRRSTPWEMSENAKPAARRGGEVYRKLSGEVSWCMGGAVDDSTAAFSPLQFQLKFEFLPLWWIHFSALGILYTGYIT